VKENRFLSVLWDNAPIFSKMWHCLAILGWKMPILGTRNRMEMKKRRFPMWGGVAV
jgi:hypothetical protein